MKPNFKNINITTDAFDGKCAQSTPCTEAEKWLTPEQISVKPIYTKSDLEGMEHLNYVAGVPPSL